MHIKLDDFKYKNYDIYIWIENGHCQYFYLQTPEDFHKTFTTYEALKKYIDEKENRGE